MHRFIELNSYRCISERGGAFVCGNPRIHQLICEPTAFEEPSENSYCPSTALAEFGIRVFADSSVTGVESVGCALFVDDVVHPISSVAV